MAAYKLPLKILQGETFAKLVTWKVGPTEATAVPVDLTGCAARMQVRAKLTSPDVLLEFTIENGGIVLGGADGTIEYARMSDSETAALGWRDAVYDLEVVFSDSSVRRMFYGPVSISPEVTRVN